MAKNIRRMLAMFLVLSMFAGAMPLQALATDGTEGNTKVENSTETSKEGLETQVTTTTTTTPNADGTTDVTVTIEKSTEGTTDAGVTVDREVTETTTTVTDANDEVISEITVEEGKENTTESLNPENVTVVVPGKAGESNTVEFGNTEPVVTGDKKQGEDDPEYDQTTTTTTPGTVTVENTGTTITDNSDATKNEFKYVNNEVEASEDNDLIDTGTEYDEAEIKEGYSHAIVGDGYYSHFGSAFLFSKPGYEGEKPAFYDKDGKPYYLGGDPATFEKYGLYVDEYFHEGTVATEKNYARWGYVQQFILIDEEGKYVTTYCADQVTSTQRAYSYVMENVEDATYYTDAQAEKIRSIANNGYWGTKSGYGSLEEVKNKMRASGQFTEAELAMLTDGMAMTATQYAIWTFSNAANGDKFVNVYAVDEKGGISGVSEEEKASVDLINKMYKYLIALDGTKTEATTVDTIINADNSIKDMAVTVVKKADDHANNKDDNKDNDAYVTDVSFALVVEPTENNVNNDDLKVTLVTPDGQKYVGRIAGNLQEGETRLVKENGTYCFRDIVLTEGDHTFTLNLEGIQNLKEGVYLYTSEIRTDSKGKDVSSQTMVGVASGKRDVNVSVDISFKLDVQEGVVAKERVWRDDGIKENDPKDPTNPPQDPQDPPQTWNRPRNQRLANDGIEIPEEPVPLAAPVITGDNTGLWIAFALMVAFCMVMVNLVDKKRQHETI